ncbi:carboxypeptidase regulatory-like domain-containing protein [Pseudacidobacterium ailaaui]|jgi:plastocyanin|uniref:carboxypeptidase regulatory-like domain-containing protein n=1 Tax=Pseudacidobacterium ailaaui TaxID=1382359 RepID=UPI00047CAA60|nr:carboxypeptidase regulatory-like domain-containing protein [Pseudacidobacterium ailaaui]MBX6359969.1 carboxypeptidase regulatory-like domain-containing protein [Pseudacidobacterium ailaaui]MDI3254752.1 carboxypeptidase regulatory-like domain-containing protein [Bacillota bacterium]
MVIRKLAPAIVVCGLLLVFTGCKKPTGGAHSAVQYTQIDWTTAGAISGTVHVSGKMPAPVQIDMAQDPVCSLSPANYSEQYVGKDGGLQNVFLYIKDGLGNRIYPAPSTPVVMDQKGCRYTPHVIGVMVGQPVRFTNSDPTMHNVHMLPKVETNQATDISQGPNGAPETRVFRTPELMIPVRCNNHPWMEAFINVTDNPFYAISGPDGHFEIRGLPPGTYTLVADHEVLGQKAVTVTIAARQTVHQDFTFAAR